MQVQQKALPLYTKHFKRSVTKHPVINLNQELDFKIHYQQQCSRGRRRENWDMGETRISFQSKGAGLFHSSQQLLVQH